MSSQHHFELMLERNGEHRKEFPHKLRPQQTCSSASTQRFKQKQKINKETDSFKVIMTALDRHLKEKRYTCSITRD